MPDLKNFKVVIPGGGSGPISIEDDMLNYIPNVTAITGITDNGGHTKKVRSVLGVSATGDATQRWAVRIRDNQQVRQLLTYRFPENGERAANTLLAAAEKITGSHAKGVELIGEAFKCHIVGNVIPVSSNKDTHLKACLSDGKEIIGEEQLDNFTQTEKNHLARSIQFIPRPPAPNPAALEVLRQADLIIIPPGSRLGSLMAVLEVPGVFEAIRASSARLVCFTNAVDVKGYKASDFLGYLSDKLRRPLDLAIINVPSFKLPETYAQEHHYFVEPNRASCLPFAEAVVDTPIAKLYLINDKPTIRHDGEMAVSLLLEFLRRKHRT